MPDNMTFKIVLFFMVAFSAATYPLSATAQVKRYEVTHEGRRVNTPGSESGPVRIGDTLYYSSLQELSESGGYIDFGISIMRVFKSHVSDNGNLSKGELTTFGINNPTRHTGNIAFDLRNNIIYFTRCRSDNGDSYQNEIYFIQLNSQSKDAKWSKPQKVGGDVNIKGYNSTHPTVGYLSDSTTILYFSSDRPGGLGGMDIWYAVINNADGSPASSKHVGKTTNLGIPVNSADNEITPFYDQKSGTLYFSSDCPGGVGKHDIYASKGSRNSWRKPTILPEPVNSVEDDLYFTIDQPTAFNTPNAQSGHGPTGYLTSNRSDSYFLYDTSCCHDIYRWTLTTIDTTPRTPSTKQPPSIVEDTCPCKKARLLLPIKLFFHNDEPNPRSLATTSDLTYFQTYNSYMFRRQEYRDRQQEISDSTERSIALAMLESFFGEVQYNSEKFEHFIHLLAQDILAGRHVVLTVGGYASPLHNSDYNKNLSKRRISTIVNQLKEYNGGMLRRVMSQPGSGSLEIEEEPFGSSTAPKDVSSSHSDQLHSVYSVDAAKERRIEILKYEYR